MKVRSKFELQEHIVYTYGNGHFVQHTFVFRPQYDKTIPEDERFAKATPTGELRLVVDNPTVVEFFTANRGKAFYLDQTLAVELSVDPPLSPVA